MSSPAISQKNASKIILNAQKLLHPAQKKPHSPEKLIQHLGYIQIDTISVIERAHHHVLWTRHKAYQPSMLDDLVEEKKVFEYWFHAASYLPISDFRFCLPRMEAFRNKKAGRLDRSNPLYQQVFNRIKTEGPLQAKDFESDRTRRSGWWNWKPAKQALEQLFMEGRLMVKGRKGFQKIYDLPERVLPPDLDQSQPSSQELARFLIRRGIQAQGIITESQISYLQTGVKRGLHSMIRQLLETGEIIQIRVEKKEGLYLTTPETLEQSLRLPKQKQIALLSPFDNFVIQRKRIQELFDFDYQLECYVPAPKRKFGYFSLPILWGDVFAGRADIKADRKKQRMIINNLVLEDILSRREDFISALNQSLNEFMIFNQCKEIEISKTSPISLRKQLRKQE
ncbi:MAG: YcaQ family DNA glycosylase [SAR324 cluster bacterium]|nr:YcaQ family DNA glycosylase [SAR324 cluster bacterium]